MNILRITVSTAATLLLASLPAHAQRPSIAQLQAQIATLQSQVSSGTIPGVAGYVTMDTSNASRPTLRVAGANLQVVNGMGYTATANGLGNVIVGYDETRPDTADPQCSYGQYTDEPSCTSVGGTWAVNLKGGSHNVVVGNLHNYSRFAGIVAGYENTTNGNWSNVVGGQLNTASGTYSVVSGGIANGASGIWSSITGGSYNGAGGGLATVSGGYFNQAAYSWATVSGGTGNVAYGQFSSVSGGANNSATGTSASVSGGAGVTASADYSWAAGTLHSP